MRNETSKFQVCDGRARHSVRAGFFRWGEAPDEPARADARPTNGGQRTATPYLSWLATLGFRLSTLDFGP